MKSNSIAGFAKSCDCTGCMSCLDICPHDAIHYRTDKNGFIRISVNDSSCVDCGACRRVCPGLNKMEYGKNSGTAEAFAAWSNDAILRNRSASGGVFAAVASYVLKCGGVVYGAAIDGFDVRHIRIDKIDELHLLQNSKYQQSITEGVYKSVRADLKAGKTVLFSGLGCQVAALYKFLGRLNTDNLYTIDTICGGVATGLPMLDLKKSGQYDGIVSFRDKSGCGWSSKGFKYRFKMKDKNGAETDLGHDNLVLSCFSSKLTKRASCLNCNFVGIYRKSDCTIGDFWGVEDFKSEQHNGISAVIVHTNKMLTLLQDADITKHRVDVRKVAKGNPNLYYGNFKDARHLLSRRLVFFFLRNGMNKLAYLTNSYNSLLSIEMRLYLRFAGKRIQKSFLEITHKS